MCTESAVTIQRAVVRCKPSLVVAAVAAPVCQPNAHSLTPPPQSVNSLIVAAVKTAARVRTTPYLSVHIRTLSRGKQAFAHVTASLLERLWCWLRVSDKSDWSDVSDLPAVIAAGTIGLVASPAAER